MGENMTLTGRAFTFGDNIDTDTIIPAVYLVTTDPAELGAHCMEFADAEFSKKVRPGDMIVAGRNFGCGSSREHAPIAIKGCGISCVIAKSFARIFFRNAINIGLPILECADADRIAQGDELEVDPAAGKIVNRTKGETYDTPPFPPFLQDIIAAGGLMARVKQRLAAQA
jgi:3-isopropylmalate/(R)-2-methylmalate dehydratase small subunit